VGELARRIGRCAATGEDEIVTTPRTSLAAAGERLDRAMEQLESRRAALAAVAPERPRGLSIRIGGLRLETPRRRRWRKAKLALDGAERECEAARDAYLTMGYAAVRQGLQERQIKARPAEAGEADGKNAK